MTQEMAEAIVKVYNAASERISHNQCERCGVRLPIGYPYHKYYENKDV